MAIERSPETRLLEGIRRDFLADLDVVAYWGQNIRIGPLFEEDEIIDPPQINLALLPSDVYMAGSGGVTKDRIPILIKPYFHIDANAYAIGGVNPGDYAVHLQKLIAAGSIDPQRLPAGTREGNGNVLDPDWTGDPDSPLRWLTMRWVGCTRHTAVTNKKRAWTVVPFMVDYEMRVVTLTRVRI